MLEITQEASMELAKLVAQSFASPGLSPNDDVTISVSLPRELVNRLRVLASEHRGDKGKPLGVPTFAGLVLTQYLIRKGMWRTDDTQFAIFNLAQRCSSLIANALL